MFVLFLGLIGLNRWFGIQGELLVVAVRSD
jgi:hypothetical protein